MVKWIGSGKVSRSDFADLHIHTLASDGQYEPLELINKLYPMGIKLFSFTDHETMFSYNKLSVEEIPSDVTIIHGIEFTTRFNPDPNDTSTGANVDVLAYGLDPKSTEVTKLLIETENRNNDRMQAICSKLALLGVPIDYAVLESKRLHNATLHIGLIIEILIKSGYLKIEEQNIIEFVNNTVGKKVLTAVLPTVTTEEMIYRLKELDAIVIIAHPGHYPDILMQNLQLLSTDGLEIYHPANSSAVIKDFGEYCDKNNLLKSGGSDYHGWFVPKYPFNPNITAENLYNFCQNFNIEVQL